MSQEFPEFPVTESYAELQRELLAAAERLGERAPFRPDP